MPYFPKINPNKSDYDRKHIDKIREHSHLNVGLLNVHEMNESAPSSSSMHRTSYHCSHGTMAKAIV